MGELNMVTTRNLLLSLSLCFLIIATESVPLEDSNLEEDEVEEEFDPTCLATETNDDSDELYLVQGKAETWEIECAEDSECPSDWFCFEHFCFPPSRRNKYYRNLGAVSSENVAKFKASLITCTAFGIEGCKCPSGFRCENEICKQKPTFASAGVSPKTVAQVGGVRKIRLKSLNKENERNCLCERKRGVDTKCYRVQCNRRQRCWCDFSEELF